MNFVKFLTEHLWTTASVMSKTSERLLLVSLAHGFAGTLFKFLQILEILNNSYTQKLYYTGDVFPGFFQNHLNSCILENFYRQLKQIFSSALPTWPRNKFLFNTVNVALKKHRSLVFCKKAFLKNFVESQKSSVDYSLHRY